MKPKCKWPQDASKETRLPGHKRNTNGSHGDIHASSLGAHLDAGTGSMPPVCPERGDKNHTLKCICPLQHCLLRGVCPGSCHTQGVLLWATHTSQVCRQSSPAPVCSLERNPMPESQCGSHDRAQRFISGRRKMNPSGVEEEGGAEEEAWLLPKSGCGLLCGFSSESCKYFK